MFEHHKKESPILSLAGVGGGPASYIFYSASGGGNEVKEISRSLRFNGEDSSNLPKLARNGTAGNQKTWTFSTWLKRGTTGSREQIFSAAGSHNTYIEFQDDQLMIEDYGGGVNFKVQLKRVFRDPSAWYHIVVVVDTTINSPESDRVKIYVNGRRETEFQGTPTYPSENYDTSVNDTGEHKLGQFPGNTNFPLKGYLADVHLVDGTAVTETNGVVDAFGFFDDYDVWQPKAYSESHGNNGFNLTFSDTSSTAAIGYDSAGSNNYTPTNLVASAGGDPKGLDVLRDSPSNLTASSGNNQGNYATLNPLRNNQTLSNGNLDVTGGSSWQRTTSTMSMGSGRFYWEYEITASNEHIIGVGPLDMQMSGNLGAGSPPGSGYGTELGQVNGTGANGSWSNTGGSTAGDFIGIIFDADAGEMYAFKNGAALNNGNYTHSGLTDGPYEAVFSLNGSSRSGSVNFGQRPYKYPLTQSKLVRNYSSNASYPASNLFDGSTTTYTAAAAFNQAFTWNPYLTDVTSLRIFVDIGSRQEQLTVVGNAGSHTTTFNASTNGWQTIDLTNSGTSIDKITFGPRGGSGQYIDVFAIEVNGTIVTDNNTPVSNSAYGSLCSTNISVPVPVSTTGFKALAYDGNGDATREITGMGHSPDFLWITQTNAGGWQHVLYDRTRGPGTSSVVRSLSTNDDRTEAQGNDTNHGFVSAFGDDGFTVDKGTQSGGSYTNHLNWNYLAYSWDAGESAVTYGPSGSGADNESSNYDILTTVRANTTTGVSVLSYTGSSNNQDKIAHGLGVTPEVWILKSRTGEREWYLYTTVYDGSVDFITINGNQGKSDSQANNPNATSISLYGSVANSSENYAGYAFRSVEGFSKFGAYTGSGNQQFIPVGFTPAWVMIKRFTDNTVGQWTIYDTANSPANEVTKKLWADAAGGEEDHTNNSIDIVSNGFVLDPGSDSGNVAYTNNGSVGYFYMAFAEHPLSTARAR